MAYKANKMADSERQLPTCYECLVVVICSITHRFWVICEFSDFLLNRKWHSADPVDRWRWMVKYNVGLSKAKTDFLLVINCELRSNSHRFWDLHDFGIFCKLEVTERRFIRQVASQVKLNDIFWTEIADFLFVINFNLCFSLSRTIFESHAIIVILFMKPEVT